MMSDFCYAKTLWSMLLTFILYLPSSRTTLDLASWDIPTPLTLGTALMALILCKGSMMSVERVE